MKGVVFHGSLEDVMRSKEQFIKNSIAFVAELRNENNYSDNQEMSGCDDLMEIAHGKGIKINEDEKELLDDDQESKGKPKKSLVAKTVEKKQFFRIPNSKDLDKIIYEVKEKNPISRKVHLHKCEDCKFEDSNQKVVQSHTLHAHGPTDKPYRKCKFCLEEFQMRNEQK